jgi:hypothetical protein
MLRKLKFFKNGLRVLSFKHNWVRGKDNVSPGSCNFRGELW